MNDKSGLCTKLELTFLFRIHENDMAFGGINVIAVGDLAQDLVLLK